MNFELGCLKEAIQDYQMMEQLHSTTLLSTSTYVKSSPFQLFPSFSSNASLKKKENFLSVEYAQGLCVGTCQGLGVAAVEFFPSVLSTLTGIGQGLWAFTCSPKEVAYELMQSTYACADYLRCHTSKEILQECVPELKELFLKWNTLNPHDRGKQIGFVIGKYGLAIFAPGATVKTAKAIHSYRNLKIANASLTLKLCAQSPEKASQILNATAEHLSMRKVFCKVQAQMHKAKQMKHMPEYPKNYIPGKSIITLSLEELENELKLFVGTGERVGDVLPGSAGYQERVDFKKIIGKWIEKDCPEVQIPTTKGIIHYDKDGCFHVVPARP